MKTLKLGDKVKLHAGRKIGMGTLKSTVTGEVVSIDHIESTNELMLTIRFELKPNKIRYTHMSVQS